MTDQPDYMDTPPILVRLTRPLQWCVGPYDLEMGDETMMPEGLAARYDEIEEVDLAERAAKLLATDEDGEGVYDYEDRRDFLSMIDGLPEDRSDDALKATLEEMAADD
ncbi:MAG: hypothetical protein ABEN55_16260 [Bradymonadaceae bacterium]